MLAHRSIGVHIISYMRPLVSIFFSKALLYYDFTCEASFIGVDAQDVDT